MENLPVQIINYSELSELIGKDPEEETVLFYFPAPAFSGFWVCEADDEIHYFVGGKEFTCLITDDSLKKCRRLCG